MSFAGNKRWPHRAGKSWGRQERLSVTHSVRYARVPRTSRAEADPACPRHYRVLGVEGPSPWFRDELTATPNCTCEWTEWGGALHDRLHKALPDLLLLVAVPACRAVGEFFQCLARNPVLVPTLAILPPDDDLLGAASQVVDDFIVVPPRRGELQHRIARLLGQKAYGQANEVSEDKSAARNAN
jgi:hypothetical protein